jgi:hypothetical protein
MIVRPTPKQTEQPDTMRRSGSVAQRKGDRTLDEEIARLRGLALSGLRARWQSMTGRQAPPHLPGHLLLAMAAYHLQADAVGDLDAATARLLKRVGSSRSDAEVAPLTDAFDQQRHELLPRTVLTREWSGHIHRVMVTKDGFAWDGSTYDSLSKIACAITGTKWNGPRFFGLRDKRPTEVKR